MSHGGPGVFRDALAAMERAAALQREVDELRAELARARSAGDAPPPPPPPPAPAAPPPPDPSASLARRLASANAEIEDLRRQIVGLTNANAELEEENEHLRREVARHAAYEAVPLSDNRDAVMRRLVEERDELLAELRRAGRR